MPIPSLYANPVDEAAFWKLVGEIGWGRKTTDFNAVRADLTRRLSKQQAATMRTQLGVATERLAKVVDASDHATDLGDDGFNDLMCHIVGLGKGYYDEYIKNPALASDLVRKNEFVESFAYCFPHDAEYDNAALKAARESKGSAPVLPVISKDDAKYLEEERAAIFAALAVYSLQKAGTELEPQMHASTVNALTMQLVAPTTMAIIYRTEAIMALATTMSDLKLITRIANFLIKVRQTYLP